MFPGRSKTNHIGGFYQRTNEIVDYKMGRYVVKTDCTVKRGKFHVSHSYFFCKSCFCHRKGSKVLGSVM